MSATGSLILDSEVRGILDTNTLYGTTENIEATGSSNLNGLSSSATASVVNPQTAQALLGAITSIASADVAHFAEGATNFGVLESLVETVITKTISAQSLFDSLSAQAQININVESDAQSLFGGLESSATLGVVLEASGEANLGGLSASGTATGGEPPVPPTPEPVYGSRGPYQRKIKPKIEPIFEPEIPKIVQTKPSNKIVLIKADTLASNFVASAEIRIDFSIREDEAELLLLI
jgi:hypothetical protein